MLTLNRFTHTFYMGHQNLDPFQFYMPEKLKIGNTHCQLHQYHTITQFIALTFQGHRPQLPTITSEEGEEAEKFIH